MKTITRNIALTLTAIAAMATVGMASAADPDPTANVKIFSYVNVKSYTIDQQLQAKSPYDGGQTHKGNCSAGVGSGSCIGFTQAYPSVTSASPASPEQWPNITINGITLDTDKALPLVSTVMTTGGGAHETSLSLLSKSDPKTTCSGSSNYIYHVTKGLDGNNLYTCFSMSGRPPSSSY